MQSAYESQRRDRGTAKGDDGAGHRHSTSCAYTIGKPLTYACKTNGILRVCLDPKDMNRTITQVYHKAPYAHRIIYRLAVSMSYCKVDAKNGFYNIHLTCKSSLLITFDTHLGRFHFKQIPFSLRMSQNCLPDVNGPGC